MKAVSDLIAPLSGEVLEVNQKVVDAPETVNEDPYGDGWLVRIRIADPAEADALLDADGLQAATSQTLVSFLSLTDADREEMLAAIGVSSVDELFRDIPEGVRFQGRARPRAGALGAGARRAPRGARRPERPRRRGALVPRRGDLRPLRPGGRRRRPPARRVPDRVHAVPAGDEPGRPAGDLRVPDRDLRADRHGRLERVRATTARPSPPTPASSPSTRPGRSKVVVTEATNPQVRQVVKTYAPGLRARGRRGAAPRRDDRPRRARAPPPRTPPA